MSGGSNAIEGLTRAAVAVSIPEAGSSVRSLCTTDAVCRLVTRICIRLRFGRVAGLGVSVEGPWSDPFSAELDNNIGASVTSEGRLTLPGAVFLVRIMAAFSTTPCWRASPMISVFDVHLHAATNERTEGWVLKAHIAFAIDGAQVIPEVVLARLEVVLNLDDTGGGYLILGQVAELEGNATTNCLAVNHIVDRDSVNSDGHDFMIIAYTTGQNRTNRP